MALAGCPECNGDVSTYANSCPNCGCPFRADNNQTNHETELKEAESIAKIFSLVAIPVLLAFGGWAIQKDKANTEAETARSEIEVEYVKLSIEMLRNKDEVDPQLRKWAANTFAKFAPGSDSLNKNDVQRLADGEIYIPTGYTRLPNLNGGEEASFKCNVGTGLCQTGTIFSVQPLFKD